MGIERPGGPYGAEMTAPPAWPEADETTLLDAADAFHADHKAVDEQLWVFQQGRTRLFDDEVWSGQAANAAHAKHQQQITSLQAHVDGSAAAAKLYRNAAGVVVHTKQQVIENVEKAQQLIEQAANNPQATSEQKTAYIQGLVKVTHAENIQLVQAGAARLGKPPASPLTASNWREVPLTPPTDRPSTAVPGDMSSGDLEAVDKANRDLLNEMANEYSHLPDGQVKTDRLADIASIRDALKTRDSHLIYLARPDDPSQMIPAATAIGNPFNADHVSVTVPGVGSTTRQSIATMTQEAAGLRQEAQLIARAKNLPDTTSTIAWMGYQPPLTLDSKETFTDALAKANAPKLESFLGDLNAASSNPNHTTALFGHSYGSLLSGIALKDGASADVSNVVLYGSPGFEATSPAQLGLSDNHFFVMSAPDDLIRPIGELAPLHGWGADPNAIVYGDTDRYRFTHLQTQAGTVDLGNGNQWDKTGASGHSEYGRDPLHRMTGYNLATILLNHPELSVQETLPPQ